MLTVPMRAFPPRPISGSMLYDLSSCERRLHLDLHAEQTARDPVSDFVAMLWRMGGAHEAAVLLGMPDDAVRLGALAPSERAAATAAAIAAHAPVILGARLELDDMLGEPDVLALRDGGYVAGDVKSGGALDDAGRPKPEYAVQVAHYAHLLRGLDLGTGATAFILDRHGEEVTYDLLAPTSSRSATSLADTHLRLLAEARAIRDGTGTAEPAMCATCKLCHWRTVCKAELIGAGDLTLVPQLGRALRASIRTVAPDIASLAALDVDALPGPRSASPLPGVGRDRLRRFVDRARLISTPGSTAYARAPIPLQRRHRELFFDIESDPGRDFIYLHGIVERSGTGENATEHFHAFRVDDNTRGAEEAAFAEAFRFLAADAQAVIYYWSKYERTAYRALQAKYPRVCSAADVEALFDPTNAVDLLYDVVSKLTEWPTHDHSIKTLAKHLGFAWRDADPSGAASITWFDEWCRTRDPRVMQRILDYNQDDCIASRVVFDALLTLEIRG